MVACIFDFKNTTICLVQRRLVRMPFLLGVAMSWMIKMGVFGPELAAAVDVKQLGVAFIGYLIFTFYMTIGAVAQIR